ncbi:MAG: MBOAT family protein [Tyzzerella sp.]|nr:MBOAT family protein [Tyzzerella sp.]
MVFSSTIFLCCFLPLMIILYYFLPGEKLKNIVLLLGSLFFYAWGEPKYVFLMIVSITGNYLGGRLIHWAKEKGKHVKPILILFIAFNIGILFYFKYFGFFVDTLANLFHKTWQINIALPIGISFYTFQGLSYIIDVYREDIDKAETIVVQRNYIKLATYISMFPQLIAGPIVRYRDILPYLEKRETSFSRFADGVEFFIRGLAKKVIFANLLGQVATDIMEVDVTMISTTSAWLGAICYMLQIFYDFSGYSDMAIGLGKMFGFEFMTNFNYPYISKTVGEFWRRWHISLSQWFRDYLYIPLGGNRRGNVYFNLLVVFLATGVWHGAAWGFILWGLWHGAFMLLERVIQKSTIKLRIPALLKWLYTMLVVLFGWVLFRLVSVTSTMEFISIMLGVTKNTFVRYDLTWYFNNRTIFVFVLSVLFCFPWKQIVISRFPKIVTVLESDIFVFLKRIVLLVVLIVCFLFITNSTYNPFIYFRF